MDKKYEISYKNNDILLKIGEKELILDENTAENIASDLAFTISGKKVVKMITDCKNKEELKDLLVSHLDEKFNRISEDINRYGDIRYKIYEYLESEDFLNFKGDNVDEHV